MGRETIFNVAVTKACHVELDGFEANLVGKVSSEDGSCKSWCTSECQPYRSSGWKQQWPATGGSLTIVPKGHL